MTPPDLKAAVLALLRDPEVLAEIRSVSRRGWAPKTYESEVEDVVGKVKSLLDRDPVARMPATLQAAAAMLQELEKKYAQSPEGTQR